MRYGVDYPLQVASLRFFDVETTGLRPDRGGRLCEVAVLGAEGVRFEWTSTHEDPSDREVASQLSRLVEHLEGGIVVGHNLQFDLRFVTYEAERLGGGSLDIQFIDTLDLARTHIGDVVDYQLGTLLAHFDIDPSGVLHTALADARATRALFWQLVDHSGLETLSDAGVQRLHWTAR